MGGYDIWDVNNLRNLQNKVLAEPTLMGEESVGDDILTAEKKVANTNIVNGPVGWESPWKEAPLNSLCS